MRFSCSTLQHYGNIMRAAYLVVLFFAARHFWVVKALPKPQLSVQSAMSALQKTGQNVTTAATDVLHQPGHPSMAESGAFYIPKPSSTQKQQEKLTTVLNGTISALSSKASDQAHQLELKLLNVTRSIGEMKEFFNSSISEWRGFITKRLEAFHAKLESLDMTFEHRIRLLERNITSNIALSLEAHRNASTNNDILKSSSGQGPRFIIF